MSASSTRVFHPAPRPKVFDCTHRVHFFETNQATADKVAAFLWEGVARNATWVVIARASLKEALLKTLEAKGVATEDWIQDRRLFILDGHETLTHIMNGTSRPTAEGFRQVMQDLHLQMKDPQGPIYAYGEMVDILCDEGNYTGAEELEAIWHDFLLGHNITLLCGYTLQNFRSRDAEDHFVKACQAHQWVYPLSESNYGESFEWSGELNRTRALNRQQALALELESEKLHYAEARLKEAELQAAQAIKLSTLGELSAHIAHEINNPLAILKNYGELIRRTLSKVEILPSQLDPIFQFLDKMDSTIQRMHLLSKNILLFSHQGDGQKTSVDLHRVIKTAIESVKITSGSKNFQIKESLGATNPLIHGNQTQLEQIFINLISNARDAIANVSHEMTGQIEIQTLESQGKFEVLITDNGVGISEDVASKIFSPFFTTKSVGRGTGLGLALAYQFVKDHQGQIFFSSEVGKGTTFKITLPILRLLPSEQ